MVSKQFEIIQAGLRELPCLDILRLKPSKGTMIINSNDNKIYYFDGRFWRRIYDNKLLFCWQILWLNNKII